MSIVNGWGNEAGAVHSQCDVRELLSAGATDIVVGPYATERELYPADRWLQDIRFLCKDHRSRLWLSVSSSTESDYAEVVSEAAHCGIRHFELDVLRPQLVIKKDRAQQMNMSSLYNLLTSVRRLRPDVCVAAKIPALPASDLIDFARAARHHGIERVVAIAPARTGTVISFGKLHAVRKELKTRRRAETLRVVRELREQLSADTEVFAAATIESASEAQEFLDSGAHGFQLSTVIFSKDRRERLGSFGRAFAY